MMHIELSWCIIEYGEEERKFYRHSIYEYNWFYYAQFFVLHCSSMLKSTKIG